MTDQEINEAVARKLGWTALQFRVRPSHAPHFTGLRKDHSVEVIVPDYCHSIEAAWEIVGHLPALLSLIRRDDGQFVCTFLGPNGLDGGGAYDTAPMAICQAFLKLNKTEEELCKKQS